MAVGLDLPAMTRDDRSSIMTVDLDLLVMIRGGCSSILAVGLNLPVMTRGPLLIVPLPGRPRRPENTP